MRLTVDSNILVYAFEQDPIKSPIARQILLSASNLDMVLTNQVLGEFLNVIRRKYPARLADGVDAVRNWSLSFPIIGTATEHLVGAALLATKHRLQFWDSVILTVAAGAEVNTALTEDLQDGATIDGVRIINPFASANRAIVQALLTPAPGTA